MFIRDVREIFSIVVSTLGAGPFLYRVWFRHGNANIQIHWANIESIIPFCPELSKYNSCTLPIKMFGPFWSVWCKMALAEVGMSLP